MYYFFAHGSWWFVLDLAKSIYIKIRPYNILLLILRDLKIKYSPDYIIIVLYKTFLLFHSKHSKNLHKMFILIIEDTCQIYLSNNINKK